MRKVSVLLAVIFILVAALLTTIGLRSASADHGFEGCVPGIGISLNGQHAGTSVQATTAAVGGTIEYDVTVTVQPGGCPVVDATVEVELPDGSTVTVATDLDIATNSTVTFTDAATYVVDAADLGNIAGAGPDQVRARATIEGTAHRGDGTTESVTASANFTTTVLQPVVVSKTVTPTFDRRFPWTITKSVDPATWNLFDGDTGTSEYTVAVTKGAPVDENFAVNGTIAIVNPNSVAVQINSVTDLVNGTSATVNCGVTFPHSLAAGATLNCTYSAGGLTGAETANTATVDAQQGILPLVLDSSATVPFTWGDPVNVIDDTVQVTDTNPEFGGPVSTSTSNTYNYNITFDCEGLTFVGGHAAFTHENTAAIVATQTFPSASASVAVDCYQLNVAKDATPTFDRTWTWDITKSADPTSATVMPGESVTVTYNVTVSVVSTVDDNFHVAGNIIITNPNPDRDAELTNVSDVVDGIAATVDCGPLPLLVPAGGTLTCTYEADLPDGTGLTNTATATQQNYDFDPAGVGTPSGTTDYSGTAPVTFGDPTNEIDECITVTDTNPNGPQGEVVCAVDAPVTFTYTETFGPFTEADCGLTLEFPNTASSVTNDTQTPDSADATVTVIVECPDEGCTPGFWKQEHHFDSWVPTGFSPSQTLESVFDVPDSLGIDNTTLVQALNFKGGSGTLGAAQILLRAAVAALLNAAHPDVNFAFTTAEIIADVNAALATGDRATMLELATELDEANNAGCPLS